MAMPRLREITQRLAEARHDAVVEDLLDDTTPSARLSLRPWQAPVADAQGPVQGRLEVTLDTAPEERVVVSFWLDSSDEQPTEQDAVRTSQLDMAWLDARVIDFIRRLLARA